MRNARPRRVRDSNKCRPGGVPGDHCAYKSMLSSLRLRLSTRRCASWSHARTRRGGLSRSSTPVVRAYCPTCHCKSSNSCVITRWTASLAHSCAATRACSSARRSCSAASNRCDFVAIRAPSCAQSVTVRVLRQTVSRSSRCPGGGRWVAGRRVFLMGCTRGRVRRDCALRHRCWRSPFNRTFHVGQGERGWMCAAPARSVFVKRDTERSIGENGAIPTWSCP